MSLRLVPVTIGEARAFIAKHHRHNEPPRGARFAVGVMDGEHLVGVATCGTPVARGFMDGTTVEVTRVCTNGTRNANSMLYGACARAAAALGYERIITYTLEEESGSSLRAAGWLVDAQLPTRGDWTNRPGRAAPRLFGEHKHPGGPKLRWVRVLARVLEEAEEAVR